MNQNKEETALIYRWNPWIGCHKKSQGCQNCSSAQFFSDYHKTIKLDLGNFNLPLQRKSSGEYYLPKNSNVALEFNGDFFIQEMDRFRPLLWNIIKERQDCHFITATKRPERIQKCLPLDWGQGWNNIIIGCTAETQKLIEQRLPIYLSIPMKKYQILTQPLIEEIDLSKYLHSINAVIAEGQFITNINLSYLARPCNYQWVNKLYKQCKQFHVDFICTLSGTKWINEKGQEEIISPYGWEMRNKIQQYHFDIGNNLYDLNNNNFQIIDIKKEG